MVVAVVIFDADVQQKMAQLLHGEHWEVQAHADDDEDAAGDVEDVHCTDAAAVVAGIPEAAAYEVDDDVDWVFVVAHDGHAAAHGEQGGEAAVDGGGHGAVADEGDEWKYEGDVLENIVAAAVVVAGDDADLPTQDSLHPSFRLVAVAAVASAGGHAAVVCGTCFLVGPAAPDLQIE